MPETAQKAVIGIKRMGVILACVAAITVVCWMAKPVSGNIPTPVVITAMTLIAAMGGVDVWKQGRPDK